MPTPTLVFNTITELVVNANTPVSPLVSSVFTKQSGVNFAVIDIVQNSPINDGIVNAISQGTSTWTLAYRRDDGIDGLKIETWYTNNLSDGAFSFTLGALNRNGFYATITEYNGTVNNLALAASPATGLALGNVSPDANPFSTSNQNIMIHMCVTQPATDTISGYTGNLAGATTRTVGAKHLLVGDLIPAKGLASAVGAISMTNGGVFHTAIFNAFTGTVTRPQTGQADPVQPAAPAGIPFSMGDQTIFTLPPNRVLATVFVTGGTLEVSNDGDTWQTVNLNTNKSAFLVGAFMRMNGGTAVANIKHTTKKNK